MKNPIIDTYTGKYGEVPFDLISTEHFMPAIEHGLKKGYEALDSIKENSEEATFKNTVEALEFASADLVKASHLYFNLFSLHSDGDYKALAEEISPKLAKYDGDVYTDSTLFARIKAVHDKKDTLDLNAEELRLLTVTYKTFIRNGALLNEEDKKKLQKIDEELSILSPRFAKNTLDATNDYSIHITDEKRVAGIPQLALTAARDAAREKGHNEGWLFTLQAPSFLPVAQFADDRELRKELRTAFGVKNLTGKFDNRDIILKTIKLRNERANLLGYKTHADYVLEERMAEKPEKVLSFLDTILEVVQPAAISELEEMKEYAREHDSITDFQAWDLSYYTEKLKKNKLDFDSEAFRPYLKAENVVSGIFEVAKKLYGLKFVEKPELPVYHEDVKVYEVSNGNNRYLGLLYVDLYPRETKKSGAWMDTFLTQGMSNGEIKRPHVIISGNLTPSTTDAPALLSINDAETLFHEFGHALHALLSDVTYKSLASPNVYWDFVELPSMIMENWLLEPETLKLFATHYETGELLPQDMVEKAKQARYFNAGNMNNRQLGLGYLDMAWHTSNLDDIRDVEEFEKKVYEKTRLLPETRGNMSTGFGHIFSGGYSSGYYSYKWSEVLDADAFELFKEKGIFNRETADSFRENILSKGNLAHPMELYVKFRGSEPDSKALLRREGLIK